MTPRLTHWTKHPVHQLNGNDCRMYVISDMISLVVKGNIGTMLEKDVPAMHHVVVKFLRELEEYHGELNREHCMWWFRGHWNSVVVLWHFFACPWIPMLNFWSSVRPSWHEGPMYKMCHLISWNGLIGLSHFLPKPCSTNFTHLVSCGPITKWNDTNGHLTCQIGPFDMAKKILDRGNSFNQFNPFNHFMLSDWSVNSIFSPKFQDAKQIPPLRFGSLCPPYDCLIFSLYPTLVPIRYSISSIVSTCGDVCNLSSNAKVFLAEIFEGIHVVPLSVPICD